MADSVIGALRVLLGVDTAAFSDGLKQANSSLDGFASAFKKVAATLAIGAVAAKFVSDINHMIDVADQLGKASQKFGVPVEQLSALKYAADLADVSFESLGKGLGKLSKAMLDSAANPAGEAAKSFQAIGLSAADAGGQLKDTGQFFGEIADKFSNMQDGAAKTALAIRLFGKAGAELIPLLNQGAAGLKDLKDEAAKLGVVISTETAAKAELFNDTIKRISAAQQGIILQITEGMLPGLQQLADAFLVAKQNGTAWTSVGELIVSAFNGVVEVGLTTILIVQRLGAEWVAFKALFSAQTFSELTAAWNNFNKVAAETQAQFAGLRASFANLGAAGAFDSLENLTAQMAKVARGATDVKTSALGSKNALDSFIDSQKKAIATAEAEAQAIGMGIGAKEKLKITLDANAIALSNNITLTAAYQQKISDLAIAAQNAAINIAAAQLKQDALTPWDLYQQKLTDINTILAKHPELAQQAAVASSKAAATMVEAYGGAAATAMGQFADFFKTFGEGNATMFAISKAFSISQAIINTYVGATKALATLPPPFGEIAAAAVVAAGLASVAKIIAEKPAAKMALGGSFIVGGAGGVDSQMVPIMATPGEKVNVEQNKYGDAGSGRTITLQGLSAKQYYRGDVLRDFVDNLNQAIGDGLKIKLA